MTPSQELRRTKILATLGPATDAPGALEAVLSAGVNVVRLNFSHGTADHHRARASAVRELAAKFGREIGILADLGGPKIRVEKFANQKIQLKSGQSFVLDCRADAPLGDETRVGCSYLGLPQDVNVGDTLLLDDGLISLEVVAVQGAEIHTRAITDGPLSDRKGLNRLGGGLSLGALTDKDRADIRSRRYPHRRRPGCRLHRHQLLPQCRRHRRGAQSGASGWQQRTDGGQDRTRRGDCQSARDRRRQRGGHGGAW